MSLIPIHSIEQRIFFFRKQKVMLSTHLADLYSVQPKVLIQAVKRNKERFPKDFMFQLTQKEFKILKSQIVTSSWGGLRRATPYAFTEQGVAMLSSVLNSKRAIQVNIEIMRAFVRLRKMLDSHKALAQKIEQLEKKCDSQFKIVFDAIRELMSPEKSTKSKHWAYEKKLHLPDPLGAVSGKVFSPLGREGIYEHSPTKPSQKRPRKGWKKAFKKMRTRKEDTLLIDDQIDLDIKDWQWT